MANQATRYNLRVQEGDTWRLQIQILKCKIVDSDPDEFLDLTGVAAFMHWRVDPNSEDITLEPTVAVTDAENGVLEAYAPGLDTSMLGSFTGVATLILVFPDGEEHRIIMGGVGSDDFDVTR